MTDGNSLMLVLCFALFVANMIGLVIASMDDGQ